jgi:hypothetical protein
MENIAIAKVDDIPGFVWVLFFLFGLLVLMLKAKARSQEEGTDKDWGELFSDAIQDAIEEGTPKEMKKPREK